MSPSGVFKPNETETPVSAKTHPPEKNAPENGRINPPKRKRLTTVTALIGVAAIAAVCVVLVVGFGSGFLIISSLLNSPGVSEETTSENAPTGNNVFTFNKVKSIVVQSDGKLYKDDKGVGLQVTPVNSNASAPVKLESNKPGKELNNALKGLYSIESMAYGASSDPSKISPPEGKLTFTAKSPDDRLAMIVDEKYIGIMPIEPVDGKLIVHTRIDPPIGTSDSATPKSGEKPTKYMVIRPIKSQIPTDYSTMAYSGGGLHAPSNLTKSVVDCSGKVLGDYCYRNTDATIYVYVGTKSKAVNPYMDLMNYCETILTFYSNQRFEKSLPTQENPLVIIVGGKAEPQFLTKSGNLQIPTDVIKDLTSAKNGYAMSHELFHWVEDQTYNMINASLDNEKSWWLEMAAENAAYLVDRSYANESLVFFSQAQTGGKTGFQLEPFKWPYKEEARYIHGQNVRVGLCEGQYGCIFGMPKFYLSINNADFPFDADMQRRYRDNADDVARYLIGIKPVNSNITVDLPEATINGVGYGDFIIGGNFYGGGNNRFKTSNNASAMNATFDNVIYKADIPAGNAIALRVSSGLQKKDTNIINMSGRPLQIRIPPGSTYFYRINNGPVQENTNLAEVLFGPLHGRYGIESIRFSAYAKSKPSKFNAVVEPVDLSGDWLGEIKNIKSQSHSCSGTSSINNQKFDYFLTLLAALGKFSRIEDGPNKTTTRFEWKQNKTVPGFEGIKIKALAEAGDDNIHLTYSMNLPKKTALLLNQEYALEYPAQPNGDTPIPWGFAVVPGAGMALLPVLKKKQRAKVGLFILLVLCLLVSSSGCGLENIYGNAEGDYVFTRLEYAEKDGTYPPNGDVYWRMPKGFAKVKVSLTTIILNNLMDSSKGTKEQTCNSTAEFELSGLVQKDGVITPDNFPR